MCGCLGPEEKSHYLGEAEKKCVVFTGDRVLVPHAYCSNGHELILEDNPGFDGKPGIKLLAEADAGSQIIYLSPFQRDPRKKLTFDYPEGTLVTLACPVCEAPLPQVAPHDCQAGAMYWGIFLENNGDLESSICVCSAWGCYASFAKLFDDVLTELRQFHPSPLLGD